MRQIGFTGLAIIAALSAVWVPSGARAATGSTQPVRPTIAAGALDTCALLGDGTAKCWGDNRFGQLGNGTVTASSVPVTVENSTGTGPLTGVVQIAVGGAVICAVTSDATVRCWGDNRFGELGVGNSTGPPFCPGEDSPFPCSTLPVTVLNSAGTGPLTGVRRIAIGYGHVCAALATGGAQCWGDKSAGQLGDGSSGPDVCGPGFACSPSPVTVKNPAGTASLTGVVDVTAGGFRTCARMANGTVECWGDNDAGQLGIGTAHGPQNCSDQFSAPCSALPVVVRSSSGVGALTGVTQVVAGADSSHTCARISNGTAKCWGANARGELGNGTTTNGQRPVVVRNSAGTAAQTGVVTIAEGGNYSCATLTEPPWV